MKDRKKSKSILKGASFFLATFAFVGLFAMGTRFVKHKDYDVYNQEMVASADFGDVVDIVYMDGSTKMNYSGTPYFRGEYTESHEYGAAEPTVLPTAGIVHKSGYVFDGWYNDSGLTDGPVTELDSAYKGQDALNDYSTADLVFYAKWTAATKRSVTDQTSTHGSFALSITTASTDPDTAYVGDEVAVTSITPDSHYSVGEVYYTKTDGTGKQTITGNKFYAPDYDIYVYVTFVETDYTITYKDEGDVAFSGVHGTGAPTTHTYFAAENLVNPTKAGYRFLGWFTDSACTAVNEITAVPAGQEDYTVYAKWEVTYAVTADAGVTNGTLSVDISQALAGEEVTVTANANTGYALTALYYIEAGDVGSTHHDINQTTKKFNAPAVAVTVYADYTIQSYTITYTLHDGSVASANPANYQVDTAEFTLTNPTKTGYTFTGWSGTDLTGDDNMTVTIAQGSTGDRTYEAHFTAQTYAITYLDKGGLSYSGSNYGSLPTSPTYDATTNLVAGEKDGYRFLGWHKLEDCSDTAVTSIGATEYTADFTLYAEWQIAYDVDTQNITDNGTLSVDIGLALENEEVTVTATPDSGYTLMALYYIAEGSEAHVNINQTTKKFSMPATDITVYADFVAPNTISNGLWEEFKAIHANSIFGVTTIETKVTDGGWSTTVLETDVLVGDGIYARISGTTLTIFSTTANLYLPEDCSLFFFVFDEEASSGISEARSYFRNVVNMDVSKFDTSSVTNMMGMFAGLESLGSLDLSTFDTTNVVSMDAMFELCYSLVSLDLTSFDTSYLESVGEMFYGCTSLQTLDLSSFDMGDVTVVGYGPGGSNLFLGECNALTTIYLPQVLPSGTVALPGTFGLVTSGYDYSVTGTTLAAFSEHLSTGIAKQTIVKQGTVLVTNTTPDYGTATASFAYFPGQTVSINGNYLEIDSTTVATATPTEVTGYTTSVSWDISNLASNQVSVTFIRTAIVYEITLDNQSATSAGTTTIYEKYENGFYTDGEATNEITTIANNITIPTKTGYTFGGYYTEVDGEGTQYINENGYLTSSANATNFSDVGYLYAKWTAKTFTINYQKQGGGDLEDDVVMPDGYPTTHTYNQTTVLPVPTRTGYRFMGWYNDAQCEDSTFTEIGATEVTSVDPIFYAKWAQLYTIATNVNVVGYATIEVKDIDNNDTTKAIETESVKATIDIDTRYQLKTNGLYYIEASDLNETHHAITSGVAFAMPDDDITIYVEIEKVPYSITTTTEVSADSQVHGTISAQATAGWNDEVVLSFAPDANYEIDPTSLYYTVASDSHTEHFAIGQYENNVFKFNMPAEAATVHGSFKLIDYTITDAGTLNGYIRFMLGSDVTTTATVGTTVTVEINPGTGYKLNTLYYTTDPTDEDENVRTAISFVDLAASTTFVMPGANIKVVATFTGRTYTVTFDPASGTMPVEQFPTAPYEQEVVYDQNYGVLPTPTRTGYNFAGWYFTYEDPQTHEEQEVLIEDNEEYSVPADITITAHWTAQQYTISYKDENDVNYSGTNLAALPTTHTYGTATPLVAGVKTGYNFLGWYDNVICTGEAVETIAADAITANQIYYAKWEAQVYTITYMDKNDGENPVPFSGVHEQGYPESHTYDTTTTLDTPTKTGYSFQGWYDNANCTGSPVTTIGPTDTLTALTFYALWEINSYTITFNSNGGSAVAAITQNYGTAITAPADPTREGYTFDGWDDDVPTTMPAEDITLTAQWHINQYTITFDTAGGSAIAAITQDYNTSVTAPADPTREGYTFGGWDRLIPTTMPAENITITAQWGVNSYTLTFDSNGGSAVSSITQNYGTEVNAPADPTRTGYTFTGWAPAVPETMPAVNQTLVAQWSVDSYNIVYKDQGNEDFSGTHGYGHPTQYVYDQLTNLVNPTKDGYTFKGWFTDPDCVYVITKIPACSRTGELTVYAKWAPNNYNVILIVDGDYFRQYPYNVTTETFLVENPTKTGYDFVGWTDGNIEPTDELYIEQGSSGNQIYTAVFEAKTYDISYVNYDGETAVGSLTAHYTYDQTTPLAPATKTGYDFIGWDLNGQTINQIAKESVYGDIQLEPVWQAKQYPITYKDQGNNAFTGIFTSQYPSTYTFEQEEPLTNPTRTGYDFVGWYTDSACTDGNEIEAIPDDQATGGITVYAKWTAQEYTITYRDQYNQNYSGSNEESLPDTHTYNVATVLVAGVRSGYTFGGWYTDSDCTAQVAQIGANTRTADFTLYAKWIKNSYDIVYRDQENADFTGSYDGLLTKYTHDEYNGLVDSTRPGYDFQGWYKDQDCATSRVYSLQDEIGEVTLYAKWTNHVFTVGLNTAYGDTGLYGILDSDNYTTEVTYLGQYGVLETPHLEHYDFLGWYSDFRFDNKVESTTIYTFTNNTILYAKWAPTTYTLTLNIDGRTEYVTFDVEDDVFTVENPTKTGYTFTGWTRVDNDHDDDYGMNYAPLNNLEDHTLTARFEVTPYTYTLVPSDEMVEKLGQDTFTNMEVFSGYNYNYITEEITLPNVDLEEYGYTFIGWTGEGTEEPTIGLTIPFHSTGDRTYTAHFTGKTYTLSFDTNGGEVDDPSKEVQYEEGYGELPVPTRENYTFVGWFDDEGNEVTAETIMSVKEGISIHARWATVTYRIKKVIDTGIAVIQLYNVESNKITLQAPTKRGYKFIGWTGTGLEEITKNVVIPTGSSGDKTFIAHFELATYTITTKVKNEIREIEYTMESEDITLPEVNLPGYAFKGWIGEDVLTPTKELVIPTGSIGNRLYTASLRALTYFITLTNDSENTRIKYTADDEDFELPTPEKEGYVFAGWLADGETEPVKNLVIHSGTTGDKHYTAVWTEYEEPAPSEDKKDNRALTIGLASAAGVAVAGGILAGAFTFVKKKKKF